MRKFIISSCAAVLAVLAACGDTWTDPETGIEWRYTVTGGSASLGADDIRNPGAIPVDFTGDLNIPSRMGEYEVTRIGTQAFAECCGITSVSIPSGVVEIWAGAFRACTGLTSVTIPPSVTDVANNAFIGCGSIRDVTVPGWKCEIDFGSVTNLVISEGTESIRDFAFQNCSGLTSVTILPGVTSIGSAAFQNCSGLTSVTIPSSVTSIWGWVFSGCSGLIEVSVDEANPNFCSLNGLLCSKDGKTLIQGVNGDVTIPSSVESIGVSAFEDCSGLTSVTICEGVTSIGEWAFSGCSGLTSVTIPSSVTSIGYGAFYVCNGLASVTISSGVKIIGDEAFSSCIGLTSVTIPSSVTSIGFGAFYGCNGLASVTISSGVKSIGDEAFSSCNGLTSVKILNGKAYVATNAFEDCVNIRDVTIPANKEIVIPSWASITNVAISEGSFIVPDGMFADWTSLESVYIPSSVLRIGQDVFENCVSLKSVTFGGDAPDDPGSLFKGTSRRLTVYVPENSIGWDGGLSAELPETWNGRAICHSGETYVWEKSRTVETVPLVVTNCSFVTVTNVSVHYVLNSVQPEIAVPVSSDTGFVNVVAEVKGASVAIPDSWPANYPGFAEKFGSDFTAALTKATGKRDGAGNPMQVWQDYVAGTDPTNPDDRFTATITMVDGEPVVSWSPELSSEAAAKRKYTKLGKVDLSDPEWTEIQPGHEADFHFFKVTVEMK